MVQYSTFRTEKANEKEASKSRMRANVPLILSIRTNIQFYCVLRKQIRRGERGESEADPHREFRGPALYIKVNPPL